jgi:hypothetical protein
LPDIERPVADNTSAASWLRMEPEPKPVCDRLVAFEVAPVFQRHLTGAGLLCLEGEHDMAAGTDAAAWVVRLGSNRESVIRRSSMIKRWVTPTPDDAALTTLRRLVAVAIR